MATKIHTLFNSGEAIEDADFMRLQKMMRAQIWDGLALNAGGYVSPDFGAGSFNRDGLLWAMGHAGACYPDTVPLKIKIAPGWIGQWVAATGTPILGGGFTGEDPQFLAYYAGIDELDTVHATGSAADRFDLVSVMISPAVLTDTDTEARHFEDAVTRAKSSATPAKRQRLTITKTLTQGASGGGIPALPSGHVPLYVIRVPAGHSGVFVPTAFNVLRDHRMPLGAFHVDVHICDMIDRGLFTDAWTKQGTGKAFRYANGNGGGATVGFLPDVGNAHARLVAVSVLLGQDNQLTQYTVVRFDAPDGDLAGATQLGIANTELRGDPTSPATEFRTKRLDGTDFGGAFGTIGHRPTWHTGWENGYAQRPEQFAVGADNIFTKVGLKVSTVVDTAQLHLVRFHFAGTP